MKQISCPNCKRIILIETVIDMKYIAVCGHGTIRTPSGAPNQIQCKCGAYL